MSYPDPQYRTATILVNVDVPNFMIPTLNNMVNGAGYGGYTVGDNVRYVLGMAIRQGLPRLDPGSIGAAYVDRFDARYADVTAYEAFLFAADVALATATATATSRTLAKVYRTAAHVHLSLSTAAVGGIAFFRPTF